MVPGCECNGKRDCTFVRIQKFGEESGALATGNGLVGENNFQIFYSPHRHNTHTHTNTDTHTLFKGRVRAFLMHEKNAEIVKPTELSFFNFNVVLFQ